MSEVKWTPGPWSVRDCPNKGAKTDLKDSGRIKLVCYNDGKYEGELAIVQTEKSQANARLIAAAPELYEALAAIIEIGELPYCDSGELAVNARAALAKARGEQS